MLNFTLKINLCYDHSMNEINQEKKIQGLFFLSDLDLIKREKGPEGLAKVQQIVPEIDLDKISPIKKYSLETEIKLLKAIAIVLYGDDSVSSWQKLGEHEMETVQNSTLGKVLLALIGKDFKNLIKNSKRLFDVFAPFVTYSAKVIDDKNAIVTMEHVPYPKEYYLGTFYAFIKMINTTGKVEVDDQGNGKHVYTVHLD